MKWKVGIILFLFYSLFLNSQDTLVFEHFGLMRLFRSVPEPTYTVIFISGDGSINQRVKEMSTVLASQDALVVTIDIIHYLKQLEISKAPCSNPAGDFIALSKFIKEKVKTKSNKRPVLVGYSSGATLVYAILVQAPPDSFQGGISIGFCPDLLVKKPFCKGNGLEWEPGPGGKGYNFLPSNDLTNPWIALQGTEDKICEITASEEFIKKIRDSEVIKLEKVGHGFKNQSRWAPVLKEIYRKIRD